MTLLEIDADIARITKQLASPRRGASEKRRETLLKAQRRRLEMIAATRTEREQKDEAEGRLDSELAARLWPVHK
jgi:hypothetical protein